jgi:hypothetical protein
VKEIPVRIVGEDEKGDPLGRREMTAEEIKERLDLNVANTTQKQRHWALTEEAKRKNGRRR